MNVAMKPAEIRLFEGFLRCSHNYLEFGAGGSTCLAAHHVRRRIISVDSSNDWLAKVRDAVSTLGHAAQINLVKADIGKTGEWGYPIEEDSQSKWPSYSEEVWRIDGATDSDLFLIDGRFRVCCFAEVVARSKVGSILILHDFQSRPKYHVVKEIARCVAVASDLAVFVKDLSSDVAAAKRMADEYRMITA